MDFSKENFYADLSLNCDYILFSLRIEVILVGIGLVLLVLEFILSIAAILTFQR